MALSNCAECGKLFAKVRSRICPACEKQEDELLEQVKDFIRDEGVRSLLQIIDGTGVDYERLMKWVTEGRLQLKNVEMPKTGCKKCGKPLDGGDICGACKRELAQAIGSMRSEGGHLDGVKNDRLGMHMRG